MTYNRIYLHRFYRVISLFEICLIRHRKCQSNKIREILVYLFMEDAAGLDYIKDNVAKRTEGISFHAKCEKSFKIA